MIALLLLGGLSLEAARSRAGCAVLLRLEERPGGTTHTTGQARAIIASLVGGVVPATVGLLRASVLLAEGAKAFQCRNQTLRALARSFAVAVIDLVIAELCALLFGALSGGRSPARLSGKWFALDWVPMH